MPRKILFITTHNLATNPRLVKELQLAVSYNYKVSVICFEFENWSKQLNEEIKSRFTEIDFYCINAGRKHFFSWLLSVAEEKIYRFLGKYFSLSDSRLSQAVSRRSNLIINEIQKIKEADLVIGHNPGAIYPSIVASQRFNCKAGFDVEDYHPGEGNDVYIQQLTLNLMKRDLPSFDYLSFASLPIQKKCLDEIHLDKKTICLSVLNYFNSDEFLPPLKISATKLKLVWFSQNIDINRGLENIIPVIKKFPDWIELHLIGNLSQRFEEILKNNQEILIHHSPMSQLSLHQKLSEFDIGLAAEDFEKESNRNLCLTNKIISYYQAGLYILASDSIAQQEFLSSRTSHGKCFKNPAAFETDLKTLYENLITVRNEKNSRFESAKKENWENESMKLSLKWSVGKSTQIDPLNPFETDPLIPFQIDPLIPAEIDPLKIG